jgi:hypothetical protein
MAWGTKKEDPKAAAPDAGPEIKPGDTPKEPEKSVADQIAEALKPFQDRQTALEAELVEARKPRPDPSTPTMVSVLEDEDTAFAQRLTPFLQKQFEIEARLSYADVEKEYKSLGYGDLWEKNRAEIEKELSGAKVVGFDEVKKQWVPIRGNPDFIRNVANMVIGRTILKEGIKYSSKESKFFLEDATGETSFISRKPAETEGLTAKQIAAAKRLKIPLKEYREAAEKLDFVQ